MPPQARALGEQAKHCVAIQRLTSVENESIRQEHYALHPLTTAA